MSDTGARAPERAPDLVLERYLLGELPAERAQALEEQLRHDPGLRSRLEALKASDRELLAAYPPEWVGRQIRMRVDRLPLPRRLTTWGWTRLWLVPATVAVVLVIAVPRAFRDQGPPGTRLKGLEPQLQLFRQTPSGSQLLEDGGTVHTDDLLQLVYNAAGEPFGAIVSVDGRAVQTTHLPASGLRAAPLRTDGPDTLDFAYRLDDAPVRERFYLVTASTPFDLDLVLRAVGEADAADSLHLRLPDGFRQRVVTLRKAADR